MLNAKKLKRVFVSFTLDTDGLSIDAEAPCGTSLQDARDLAKMINSGCAGSELYEAKVVKVYAKSK